MPDFHPARFIDQGESMSTTRRSHLLQAAAAMTLAATTAWAQPAAPGGTFEPRVGQAGKDVIWVPTPDAMVDRMLSMAEVTAKDFVIDLGSGDGKIAIAAVRNRGARALGIEYNPDMVELSNRRARDAGVADKVQFVKADIFASDFSKASVITMYLLPGLNLKLRPTLLTMKPGTRLTSHSFDMGEWTADEMSTVNSARGYLWIVPANIGGTWTVNYTGRVLGAPPQSLTVRQTFQKIEGEAQFGNIGSALNDARLRGDTVQFTIRDAQGQRHLYTGRADGNRITGTVVSPGKGQTSFTAQRTTAVQPLDVPVTQAPRTESLAQAGSPFQAR